MCYIKDIIKKDCYHLMGLKYIKDRPELIVIGNCFCRSFFPETQKDYTKNQALWTLLYKKKINLGTGLENVLYDRLK